MFNFQNVLHSHPPNQVLSALQALTSRQQVVLEEKIAALNVERDISDLGYIFTLKCTLSKLALNNHVIVLIIAYYLDLMQVSL